MISRALGELLTSIVELVFSDQSNTLKIYPNGEIIPHALLRTCKSLRRDFFQLFLLEAPHHAKLIIAFVQNSNLGPVKGICLRLASRLAPTSQNTRKVFTRFHLNTEWRRTFSKLGVTDEWERFARDFDAASPADARLLAVMLLAGEVDGQKVAGSLHNSWQLWQAADKVWRRRDEFSQARLAYHPWSEISLSRQCGLAGHNRKQSNHNPIRKLRILSQLFWLQSSVLL